MCTVAINKSIIILICVVCLSGCIYSQVPTRKAYMESTIGKNISSIKGVYVSERSRLAETNWTYRTYRWKEVIISDQGDGHTIYKYINPYRDCVLVFVVGGDGLIRDARSAGEQC